MINKTYQELKADAEIRKENEESARLKALDLPKGTSKPSYHSIPGKREWIFTNGRWKKF